MNDLLTQLSQRLGAGGLKPREYMRWVQASVGANIRMIPTSDILFFRAEDKYTRVQTRALRGPDPQADQGADRRAGPGRILANPSRHRGSRRRGRAGQPRLSRPPDRAREGQRGKARSEPHLQSSVQADVGPATVAAEGYRALLLREHRGVCGGRGSPADTATRLTSARSAAPREGCRVCSRRRPRSIGQAQKSPSESCDIPWERCGCNRVAT